MGHEFRKILPDVAVTPAKINDIGPVSSSFSFSREPVENDTASCRPYINDRLNSRSVRGLMYGSWKVLAATSLTYGSRPQHLLHGAGGVIVQGDGLWQLFNGDLQLLDSGSLDNSDVFLDANNALFYFADEAGMIVARKLNDGSQLFCAPLLFGPDYYRSFLTRVGDRMIIVSTEQVIDQDCDEIPEDSTVEVLELHEPLKVDSDGILRSGSIVADLIRETLEIQSAVHGEHLVTATADQICIINSNLEIELALNGFFEPLAISLDSAGIIYIVLTDNDVLKLRAVTQNGERLFSAELPADLDYQSYPPIIGYDHRIYLLGTDRLMAFARGGLCVWEYRSSNPIAGAIVTPNNELIITSGSELGAFDPAGFYRLLYQFEGETIHTPPALNERGELLVATDQTLYCLTAVS